MGKIVVLVGSPRKGGNTSMLVDSFVQGARQHHEVEIISVSDVKVNPCLGCNACFVGEKHSCVQQDDMGKIYDTLKNVDVLVIASPVYFYGISSQLKAVIDRLHNPIRDTFAIKRLALLAVGAAELPELFDAIKTEYQLVLNFFKLDNAGMVLVRGVNAKGDIVGNPALKEAFDLGLKI